MNINESLYQIADSCIRRLERVNYNPKSDQEDYDTIESVIESLKNLQKAILESEE